MIGRSGIWFVLGLGIAAELREEVVVTFLGGRWRGLEGSSWRGLELGENVFQWPRGSLRCSGAQ